MSFFGIHILTDAQLKALEDAGHKVESYVVTEADKALLAIKQDKGIIGTIMADINAIDSSTMTGLQKMETVVANTMPIVLKVLTGGGVSVVLQDVEDVTRALTQGVYNDFKSTSLGKIAGEIVKAIGL
jgi:hypothetical protein